jgi:biopolymer transport protein ExbD
VIVSLNRDGQIFIGDAETPWEEFGAALPDVVRRQAGAQRLPASRRGRAVRQVLQVLGAMKALDVATVGLVAEPVAESRLAGRGQE